MMVQIRFNRKEAGGLLQWSEWSAPYSGILFGENDELRSVEGRLLARWLVGKWHCLCFLNEDKQWDGWIVQSLSPAAANNVFSNN